MLFNFFEQTFLLDVFGGAVNLSLGIIAFIIFKYYRIFLYALYPCLYLVQTVLDYLGSLFYFGDFFQTLCLYIRISQNAIFKLFDAAV